jgi:hypothetical protein
MQRQRKDMKIYREEDKERLTTHWDLDYVRTAEFETAMAAGRQREDMKPSPVRGTTTLLVGLIKRMVSGPLGKRA